MDWCSKCHNSGRTGSDSVIQYCDCLYGKKLRGVNYRLLFHKANLPDSLVNLKLEDFWVDKNYKSGDILPTPQIQLKKYAKQTVLQYEKQIANAMQKKDVFLSSLTDTQKYRGNNLFFYGGDDSGKTMLAVHVLKMAIYKTENNLGAYYIMWDDFLSELIPFGGDWELLVDRCKSCGILCIDSINNTDVAYNKYAHVYSRINMVLKNRVLKKKPTILTSSYSPKAFLQDSGNIFTALIKKSLCVKLDNNYHLDFNQGGSY